MNCDWTLLEALARAERLKEFGLQWLEQPVWPPENYDGLAQLPRTSGIPIAGGENVSSSHGLFEVWRIGESILVTHHRERPLLGIPHGDAWLDLTDLIAFPRPGGDGDPILILIRPLASNRLNRPRWILSRKTYCVSLRLTPTAMLLPILCTQCVSRCLPGAHDARYKAISMQALSMDCVWHRNRLAVLATAMVLVVVGTASAPAQPAIGEAMNAGPPSEQMILKRDKTPMSRAQEEVLAKARQSPETVGSRRYPRARGGGG